MEDTQVNVLDYVADKKYSDFSAAVKQELLYKLGNSNEIKSFASEFDKIQQMKNLFSQISNVGSNSAE